MKKILRKIIKVIIVGIVVLLIGSKMNHEIRLVYESRVLQQLAASEWVEIKNCNIHTVTKKNPVAEDTIVFLHGLGMGDTTITAEPMLMPLKVKHNLFMMDRYGNGLSEDTNEPQTAEQIVNLYRSVLLKTEQKVPYILVAHSIAGIYATYWAQQYPEEIKAVIYLDADPVECYVQEGKIDTFSLLVGKCEYLLANMGLQRIFTSEETLLGQVENQVFTEEENFLRKCLIYCNTASKATCSEMELYYENAQTVLECDIDLQMPQLYIIANNVQGEYYNEVYSDILYESYNGNEGKIQGKIASRIEIIEEKKRYMSSRSNLKTVEISGPHCLYEYNPQGISEEIADFLEKVH